MLSKCSEPNNKRSTKNWKPTHLFLGIVRNEGAPFPAHSATSLRERQKATELEIHEWEISISLWHGLFSPKKQRHACYLLIYRVTRTTWIITSVCKNDDKIISSSSENVLFLEYSWVWEWRTCASANASNVRTGIEQARPQVGQQTHPCQIPTQAQRREASLPKLRDSYFPSVERISRIRAHHHLEYVQTSNACTLVRTFSAITQNQQLHIGMQTTATQFPHLRRTSSINASPLNKFQLKQP